MHVHNGKIETDIQKENFRHKKPMNLEIKTANSLVYSLSDPFLMTVMESTSFPPKSLLR